MLPYLKKSQALAFLFALLLVPGTLLSPAKAQKATLPDCRYDDLDSKLQAYEDWRYTLLDTIYRLPESYIPPDLVSAAEAGLTKNYLLRSLIVEDLQEMLEAAVTAAAPLELQSAYRSYNYQARTFDYWVSQEGYVEALKSSARAGHSEHQLGTVLDFRSAGGRAPWDYKDWALTPAGEWLAENAWRYGFVMSYPKGKEEISCYIYEPWHYRYIGREAAAELKQSGLTLREWLWLKNN